MRKLLLLRHAQARLPDNSGKDFDRPLSENGEKDALTQAKRLRSLGLRPDFILCSAAKRTMQTAGIFSEVLHTVSAQPVQELYRANATGYISTICTFVPESAQCVLLVGHNPSIEDCALLFAQDDNYLASRIHYGFPTAGLALIETTGTFCTLTPKTAQLSALYLPHET